MLHLCSSPRTALATAPFRTRVLIAFGLGCLSALAFAPFYWWPLFFAGIVGLVWLIDTSTSSSRCAALGWSFGFGYFIFGLSWLSIAFQSQILMPVWLGYFAVVGLGAVLAMYQALAFWASHRLWSRSSARILTLAAFWGIAEWLRGHLLTGFPWNGASLIWAETPAMLQFARHVGAYGLSFLTIAIAGCFALLADHSRSSNVSLVGAGLLVGAVLADGANHLNHASLQKEPLLRVHLVQANIRQQIKHDPAWQYAMLERYEQMTTTAIKSRGPALVVWPETAISYDVAGSPDLKSRLGRLLMPGGNLVLGAVRPVLDDRSVVAAYNSMLVLNHAGTITASYDKAHLVPFGEYLPLQSFMQMLGLQRLVPGSAIFLPGKGVVTLRPPGLPSFSPLICYEAIFSGSVVDRRNRPAWILNISNDAWFGISNGPSQHLAQARLRAVEEGLAVARVTPTGITAIIDPYGRVAKSLELGDRAVLTGDILPPLEPTLFVWLGDWLFALMVAVALSLSIARRSADFKLGHKGPVKRATLEAD